MKRHLYSTSFYRKLTFLFRTGWTNVIRRQFGWIFFLYLLLLWVMRCLLLLLVARGGKSAVDWALFLWNASVVSTLCGQKIFRALMLRAHNQMKAGKKKDVTKGSFNNYVDRILPFLTPPPSCVVGLYQTSRPVWKSGKFSKSGLSGNRTFSILDTRL